MGVGHDEGTLDDQGRPLGRALVRPRPRHGAAGLARLGASVAAALAVVSGVAVEPGAGRSAALGAPAEARPPREARGRAGRGPVLAAGRAAHRRAPGGILTVVRRPSPVGDRLFWVTPDAGGNVRLTSFDAAPATGERYLVLDEHGALGTVEVTGLTGLEDPSCPGAGLVQATAHFVERASGAPPAAPRDGRAASGAIASSEVVLAIGPLAIVEADLGLEPVEEDVAPVGRRPRGRPGGRASERPVPGETPRVILPHELQSSRLPRDRSALLFAVDATGDGQPDRALYGTSCADERRAEAVVDDGVGAFCFETWTREGSGWRRVRRNRHACE